MQLELPLLLLGAATWELGIVAAGLQHDVDPQPENDVAQGQILRGREAPLDVRRRYSYESARYSCVLAPLIPASNLFSAVSGQVFRVQIQRRDACTRRL